MAMLMLQDVFNWRIRTTDLEKPFVSSLIDGRIGNNREYQSPPPSHHPSSF
jgi:hypothetical protein